MIQPKQMATIEQVVTTPSGSAKESDFWVIRADMVPPVAIRAGEDAMEPMGYFRTSGEATWKAAQLIKEHKAVLYARRVAGVPADDVEAVIRWAKQLHADLVAARGPAVFLECEWLPDRRLGCKAKNPRSREADDA